MIKCFHYRVLEGDTPPFIKHSVAQANLFGKSTGKIIYNAAVCAISESVCFPLHDMRIK